MRFSFLSLHPKMLISFFGEGLLKKAADKNLIEFRVINIRDYAEPPHYRVDDKPYGGGAGMILKAEPILSALDSIGEKSKKRRVILLSAKGKLLTQRTALRLARYEELVFIAGRYEGVDERVLSAVDEEIRIGNYVLMGGEVAAAVIVEAVARLLPGVIGNPESLVDESFSVGRLREYVQYTRPRSVRGMEVPDVLIEGDHKKIREWREKRRLGKRPSR